jgi:O-antigen ligase
MMKELSASTKQKSQIKEDEKLGSSMFWLTLMIFSLFYCLPLGRYTIAGISTDFRIYDFMFIVFLLFVGAEELPKLQALIKDKRQYHRFAWFLILMVIFSIAISFITRGRIVLSTFIRVYRFMMYFLVGSFTFIILNTPKRQKFALNVYYINVIFQVILAFAQSMGWLPNFWPAYWLEGYGDFPVGTLSPHHLQIGIIMLIGIGLSMMFFRLKKNIFIRVVLVILLSLMMVVTIRSELRTAWVSLIGWLIAYVIIYRERSIWPILLLTFGIFLTYFLFGNDIWVSLQDVLDRRLIYPYEARGFRGVLSDREAIYADNPFNILKERPWILFTGAGFQNVSYVLGGATGAHNNYLQVFFELGVFGLIIYMLFLKSIYDMLKKTAKIAETKIEQFLANDTLAIYFAVLISMLAGETMWAQYSAFTLTGQIMVFIAIAVSPLNWLLKENKDNQVEAAN